MAPSERAPATPTPATPNAARVRRVLGVAPDAPLPVFRRAWRRAARRWHPDRFARDPRAREAASRRFVEAQAVYRAVLAARGAPGGGRSAARSARGRVPGALSLVLLLAALALGILALRGGPGLERGPTASRPTGGAVAEDSPPRPQTLADPGDAPGVPTPPRRAPAPAPEPASERAVAELPGHVTLGSHRSEVLAVLGEPGSRTGRLWTYGLSRVRFSGDRVVGWDSHPASPLRVHMDHDLPPSRVPDTLTVGSTRDEVVAVLGTPTAVTGSRWWYGLSTVRFRAGAVAGFDAHPAFPLPVRRPPRRGLVRPRRAATRDSSRPSRGRPSRASGGGGQPSRSAALRSARGDEAAGRSPPAAR